MSFSDMLNLKRINMRIETDRLILRNYKMLDLMDYIHLMTQEKIANRAGFNIKSNERLVQNLKEETGNEMKFAIVLKGTDSVIGEIGLNGLSIMTKKLYGIGKNEIVREVEFCLSEEYWGKGYMTEALEALIKVGFEEFSLDTIVGASFSRNLASKKVQIKCGLIPFKMDPTHVWRETGETCKVILSKMTKEQYGHIDRYKKMNLKITYYNRTDEIMEDIEKIINSSTDKRLINSSADIIEM